MKRSQAVIPALLIIMIVLIMMVILMPTVAVTIIKPLSGNGPMPESDRETTQSSQGVSQQWRATVQKEIQKAADGVTMAQKPELPGTKGSALRAANPAHKFETWFADQGVRLAPRGSEKPPWTWGLTLKAYSVGPNKQDVPPVKPSIPSTHRVGYRQQGLVEWYVNDAKGLEQGFTLTTPPASTSCTLGAFIVTAEDNGGAESIGNVTAQVTVTSGNGPPLPAVAVVVLASLILLSTIYFNRQQLSVKRLMVA